MSNQFHGNQNNKQNYISIVKKLNTGFNEEHATWIEDGWDFLVLTDGNQTYRFPRRKDVEKKLCQEVKFVTALQPRTPIEIPRLLLLSDKRIGTFVTYPHIVGVPLKRDFAHLIPSTNLREIARQIGTFLTTLHSFPVEGAKSIGLLEENSVVVWTDHLRAITKNVFPHISIHEQRWTTDIFENFIRQIKQNPIEHTVIHGDIMPEHILVNKATNKLMGIIDFGDVEIADPAYDFTFLKKYGENFLKEAYHSYALKRDPKFNSRRQFYEDRLVITNLEHSIKIGDRALIEQHKHELTTYIA